MTPPAAGHPASRAHRAPRARRVPPRAPGLVHAARATSGRDRRAYGLGRSPRSPGAPRTPRGCWRAQDAVYTLIERGPQTATAPRVVEALSARHDGADTAAWLAHARRSGGRRPHRHGHRGRLPAGPARDRPASLAGAGAHAARARAPGHRRGQLRQPARQRARSLRDAVLALADADRRPRRPGSSADVSFVSTMVDRITPATTEADRDDRRAR